MKKFLVILFLSTAALADEGMWLPRQMPALAAQMKALGFSIDPARLADLTGDPMGAVVSLGGCTASFVSPDGLVVTNHHCAFGSIQHNSTAERDLISNGFLAKTREEELPAAPGTKVWVTTSLDDVTARMTGNIKSNVSDADRAKLLDRREKELVAECEKPGGVRCRVASFFEGSQYMRQTQAELTDIRLVYAPSDKIGDFGGEVDNFEWPRHTGDFAFYRVYVDGKPYHPKHWLRIAKKGVSPGDAVLVAGYPGRTFRYKTADEVRAYRDFIYPSNIRTMTETIRLLEEAAKGNRDVQIKNASRIQSLANSLKNYQSVNEGFVKDRIVESREQREAKMGASDVMKELARLNAEQAKTRERDFVLEWLVGRGSPMLSQAMTAVRLANERPKADVDRMARFQERNWPSLLSGSTRAQRTIDVASDRAVTRYFLEEAAKLPATQHVKVIDDAVAAAGGVEPFLDRLYGNTKLADEHERAKMLAESSAQLRARHDAMLDFAASLVPLFEERETNELASAGALARLRPAYFEQLRKVAPGELYPDANGTLRITIGKVEGYSPKDATWMLPQTSLRGVLQKETGKEPFTSPQSLRDAAADAKKTAPYIDPELKDVPVNFLSTADTTGGNSGSPTLNANGELIGLLFDGNYESIDADFLFTESITRSIHVDAQYMLWIMDAVDGADALMRELGVEPKV
ncbi:MAG TPA: S46 family peptidase [Thermoanaerobaculia bacterium]|nr:S46 family peptidase [Thermoanaerobaculia bacterium]